MLPTKSYYLDGRDLFERADTTSTSTASATSTDSNGCIVCPSSSPSCPTCDDGYQCALTVQSCTVCAKTYCKASATSSTSSSTKNVGGIVGGTLAGVVVLGVLLFLFYKYYYQRKVAFNRIQHKEFFFDDDAEINFHHNRDPPKRSSMATVFTRASNIIPIAYIPGVTIGPSGSSRMSTVSESGTVSSEFIGDRYSKASIVNPALTTTAIRAKPKLVSVTEVKPIGSNDQDAIPGTAVGAQQLGGVKRIIPKHDMIEEEDEDVQSVVMKDDNNYEPFIIDDDDKSIISRESNGSVLLEVEIDSPFEDALDK